jgi:hypothetical protein
MKPQYSNQSHHKSCDASRVSPAIHSRRDVPISRFFRLAAIVLGGTLAGGCQFSNVASFPDQQTALMEIAPIGTPREEVARKLKEAGVSYQPSPPPDPGVFYCESWEMPNGERFLMASEILFDSEGRLLEIREVPNNHLTGSPADADGSR